MIFYKNLKKPHKIEKKSLVFSIFQSGVVSNKDESVLEGNVCTDAYNVSFCDGALKTGLGVEDLKVPESAETPDICHTYNFDESSIDAIQKLWVDRWYNNNVNKYFYQLLMTGSDNTLYGVILPDIYEGTVVPKSFKLRGKHVSFGRNYRIENEDCSIFFTDQGMIYSSYTSELIFPNVPEIISCVVHYGNFFGITNTNRNTLVYTKNLNLKEWDDEQSSTIEFLDNRGSFTKLILFNDYVYLFREYGITKISLYSSKDNFSFTHLYTSTSKIFENSVCVCGDVVLFATRDGIYKFNGNSATRIFENYDRYIKNCDNTNCTASCLDGKYYLATKCKFGDGKSVGCEMGDYVNNILFEFDITNQDVKIMRGVDVKELLAFDTPFLRRLCVSFNHDNKNKVGQISFNGKNFEKSNQKFWQSAFSDLGEIGKRKCINELLISSKYDCKFEVISDEENKVFDIFGQENEQRLQISVYGKHFKFAFKTDNENIEIKKPVVFFDVLQ